MSPRRTLSREGRAAHSESRSNSPCSDSVDTNATRLSLLAQTQAYLQALLANPAEELRVRSAALQALAYFKAPEVLEQFKALMWSNNAPELTRALIPALASLGTKAPFATHAPLQEKVSTLLAHFLLSGHDNTRHIQPNLLAQALGRVPHPKTVKILQEALKSNQTLAQKKRIRTALRHIELAQKRAQTR